MTQLKYQVKINHLIYLENQKIQAQVNRLRNLVQLRDKQGHVSLYLLKKVMEEGKKLQRAFYFYGIDKHWTEFINEDY